MTAKDLLKISQTFSSELDKKFEKVYEEILWPALTEYANRTKHTYYTIENENYNKKQTECIGKIMGKEEILYSLLVYRGFKEFLLRKGFSCSYSIYSFTLKWHDPTA